MGRVKQDIDFTDPEIVQFGDKYDKWTEDNWPMCPECGSDTLDNHNVFITARPDGVLHHLLIFGMRCYSSKCDWQSVNYNPETNRLKTECKLRWAAMKDHA